jgi:hypothetical protein
VIHRSPAFWASGDDPENRRAAATAVGSAAARTVERGVREVIVGIRKKE